MIEIGLTTFRGASADDEVFYWELRFDRDMDDHREMIDQLYAQMVGWA